MIPAQFQENSMDMAGTLRQVYVVGEEIPSRKTFIFKIELEMIMQSDQTCKEIWSVMKENFLILQGEM